MKKILFPTDFSETAKHAFIYALHVADKMGASITTLHSYTIPDVGATTGFILPHMLQDFYESIDVNEFENYKNALPSLRKIADDNGFSHVQMQHALVSGPTVRTIIKEADKEQVDLIVMGTDGARGLKEIFVGTNTAEVMEHANMPVLAVPAKAKFDGQINKLAATTEYIKEEESGFEKVLEFANYFNAEVHCLNVDLHHTHKYLDRMKDLKEKYGDRDNITFNVLEGEHLEATITKYLKENDIDALAMMTHKRNFIEELFHYSIAKQMAYHSTTPILSIPAHILKK